MRDTGIGETTEVDFLGRELRTAAAVATLAEMERLHGALLMLAADEANAATVGIYD